MRSSLGVRTVALLEAVKGLLVLLVGFGLLALIHHDVQHVAGMLVQHLHLNPAKRYPRIFIDAATAATDARLWVLAGLALPYAGMRLIEAYGLWQERRWAEWLAVGSGGIYVPAELYEMSRGITWINALALIINAAIVLYMSYTIWRSGNSIEAAGRRQSASPFKSEDL